MKIITLATLSMCFLAMSSLSAQLYKNDITHKEAFTIGFPQFYAFRGEMHKKTQLIYETWSAELESSNGVLRKFINEELFINPITVDWANSFAKEHPEKLMLLHHNGEARQVIRNPALWNQFFPGHWVYEAGTILKEALSKNGESAKVENSAPFVNRKYRGGNGEGKDYKKEDTPNYALLVKLDENGNRLWYESELVEITKVDVASNVLTLKRGICDTKALSFDAERTYVAPIAGGVWGEGVMFFYNRSIRCPKDKEGRTASDIEIDEIAQWFSPKGILKNLNGIAFDVNYFDIADRIPQSDTNNDGVKDGGWISNRNEWKSGDYLFLKKLRARMGLDFIITADGQLATNQQAVGILNGIESEGLVQPDDGWRGFSRTVNTHQYWEHNNTIIPQFRYVALKLGNKSDALNSAQLQRFAIGTACCLKAFVTDPDAQSGHDKIGGRSTVLPEWMTVPGALGHAKGELIHFAKQSPEICSLRGAEIVKMIHSEDCNFNMVNDHLEIVPKAENKSDRDLLLNLDLPNLPSGDITIFVELKSIEPVGGMSLEESVPRTVWANMEELPDYGEGKKVNKLYNELTGVFGTAQFEELSFYYRGLKNSVPLQNRKFNLKIQGDAKLAIRSIKIYQEADILMREFEKGVVIVNPSLSTIRIHPTEFGKINQNLEIPALDASFIQY